MPPIEEKIITLLDERPRTSDELLKALNVSPQQLETAIGTMKRAEVLGLAHGRYYLIGNEPPKPAEAATVAESPNPPANKSPEKPPMAEKFRVCRKCKKNKPPDQFFANPEQPCRRCILDYQKARREKKRKASRSRRSAKIDASFAKGTRAAFAIPRKKSSVAGGVLALAEPLPVNVGLGILEFNDGARIGFASLVDGIVQVTDFIDFSAKQLDAVVAWWTKRKTRPA